MEKFSNIFYWFIDDIFLLKEKGTLRFLPKNWTPVTHWQNMITNIQRPGYHFRPGQIWFIKLLLADDRAHKTKVCTRSRNNWTHCLFFISWKGLAVFIFSFTSINRFAIRLLLVRIVNDLKLSLLFSKKFHRRYLKWPWIVSLAPMQAIKCFTIHEYLISFGVLRYESTMKVLKVNWFSR